jgi:hypothetical protein
MNGCRISVGIAANVGDALIVYCQRLIDRPFVIMVVSGVGGLSHMQANQHPMFARRYFQHCGFKAALALPGQPVQDVGAVVARLGRILIAAPAHVIVKQSGERIEIQRVQSRAQARCDGVCP